MSCGWYLACSSVRQDIRVKGKSKRNLHNKTHYYLYALNHRETQHKPYVLTGNYARPTIVIVAPQSECESTHKELVLTAGSMPL